MSLLPATGEDRAHDGGRRPRNGGRPHVRRRRDALSCPGRCGRHAAGESREQERRGAAGGRRRRAPSMGRTRRSITATRQGGYSMRRRDVLKTLSIGTAAVAIGPFIHARPARADKGELVIVGWGG